MYINTDETLTIYGVRGSSVEFKHQKKSLIERWNQVALEILLASMGALMCFALFIFAVYCYVSIDLYIPLCGGAGPRGAPGGGAGGG